eukprot:scaffold305123_cov28-Attheya_sp.AAC.1
MKQHWTPVLDTLGQHRAQYGYYRHALHLTMMRATNGALRRHRLYSLFRSARVVNNCEILHEDSMQ